MTQIFTNGIQDIKSNQPVRGMAVSDVLFDVLDDVCRHAMVIDTGQSGEIVDDVLIVMLKLVETEFEEPSELVDIVANRWWRGR